MPFSLAPFAAKTAYAGKDVWDAMGSTHRVPYIFTCEAPQAPRMMLKKEGWFIEQLESGWPLLNTRTRIVKGVIPHKALLPPCGSCFCVALEDTRRFRRVAIT